MFKSGMLFAALTVAASGTALAVTQDINLTAKVKGSCTISNSLSPSAVTQALTVSDDGYVSTTPVNLSFPVACNQPATLNLQTANKGLVGPTASGNYSDRIEYSASVSGGAFPDINLLATRMGPPQPAVQSAGPISGVLNVSIVPYVNTSPLTAGNYADTLSLVVEPLQ